MIFEAFESNVISKVNKFLTKKIGKLQSDRFIEELKRLKDNFEFPINQIKDSDVEYLSKKKAINIKTPSDWEPKSDYGIYVFKFWFSLEEGYLGYTGIGDKEIEFEDGSGNKINRPFSDEEIKFIKDKLNIKKGELKPVTNYNSLMHGDELIGYFDSVEDSDKLAKAKLFISGDSLYAIQNVSGGSTPNGTNWQNWGPYSWCLGNINEPGNDHKKLHKYTKTDEDLHVILKDVKSTNNIFNWNLPIRYDYLSSWNDSNYGIDVIEKADFCLMINFDNIISRGYKKVSATKAERVERRKDAAALYTDEQIKNINIDRYMTTLINRMGISVQTDVNDLKSLEKVLKVTICDRYPIYSLFSSDGLDFMRRFISDLKDVIRYKGDEYEFKTLKDRFIRVKKENISYSNSYKQSEDIIFKSDNQILIDIFNKVKSINNKITDYINKQDIKTLSDLSSIYYKLEYIRRIFEDESIGDLKVRSMIRNMYDTYDIKYYIEQYRDTDYIKQDIDKLNNIDRYIDSILN